MLAVGEGEIEKGKETGRIKELQCKIYAYGERNNTAPQIFFQARSLHGHATGPLLSREELPTAFALDRQKKNMGARSLK